MTILTTDRWHLANAEALAWLRSLPTGTADALITDPPYSSGGFTRGDRMSGTSSKYVNSDVAREYPEFTGDNRDQRSWVMWCSLWLDEARRVVKPGGYVACFIDWRQLPSMTDALQSGGWVWRGIAAWDKGRGARAPHTGYFRHQCEYIVWGSNGPLGPAVHGGPWNGAFQYPVLQADKHHMTGKPSALMRELARIVPEGGVILDPFAGSASTGVGALMEGRRFLGCELSGEYHEIGTRRLQEAEAGHVAPSTRMSGTASLFGVELEAP